MSRAALQPEQAYQMDPLAPFEGLTAMQYRFVINLFTGMTQADAYRATFDCSAMTNIQIGQAASVLTKMPAITAKLRALRQQTDAQITLAPALTADFVIKGITNLAMNATKENVQLQAFVHLGKVAGIDLFRETSRVEHVQRTPEDVDRELRAKLADLAQTIEGTARAAPASSSDRRRKPRAPAG